MKAAGCWEQFMNSGTIRDYLAYKEQERREAEERFYAGFSDGDRDDPEDGAGGRI